MDNLYNIQQLKECFGQQTKIYVLDISKAVKRVGTIEQNIDDTIIRKLQAENNIQLRNQLNVIDRRIITVYLTMELGSRMIQFT